MHTLIRAAAAGAVLAVAVATPAMAGLPALKTSNATASKASSVGPGGSALEPYLITLLLPVAGIVMAVSGVGADRYLRRRGGG